MGETTDTERIREPTLMRLADMPIWPKRLAKEETSA